MLLKIDRSWSWTTLAGVCCAAAALGALARSAAAQTAVGAPAALENEPQALEAPDATEANDPLPPEPATPNEPTPDEPVPNEPVPDKQSAAAPASAAAASSGDAAAAETTDEPEARRSGLSAAKVDGVEPGNTTREQLHEAWGKPRSAERIAGGAREIYQLDGLGAVRVTIVEDVVDSLAVHVEPPVGVPAVVRRLELETVEPVDVYDDRGELLGAAYPPSGILLGYVPRSKPPRVYQVIVEPIDAQMYLARAEARLPTRYADCLTDLEQVMRLSPESVEAYRLHAQLSLRTGNLEAALRSAEKAIQLDPKSPGLQLLSIEVLAASGDLAGALARLRSLSEQPGLSELVSARTYCLWGTYLAHGAQRDTATAIGHHQRAVKLAEPLAHHEKQSVRRAAKELLLDAHLGVAYDIGWGRWQQKGAAAQKWIERAASLADDLVANERAGGEVYLRLYGGALDALAGVAEPPDAQRWIRGLRQLGRQMYDEATDPVHQAQLAWQIARAMTKGIEIEAARGKPQQALALGKTAFWLFEQSGPAAERLPTYHYDQGRLCYRLGVIFAVNAGDHGQAVAWFERATPLLEKPVPEALIDSGTQGEAFVGMAISYWELDDRREALRLTSQGLSLMEQAVDDGRLEAAALAVPYGNLASMHETLGDYEAAKKFAALANRLEPGTATK